MHLFINGSQNPAPLRRGCSSCCAQLQDWCAIPNPRHHNGPVKASKFVFSLKSLSRSKFCLVGSRSPFSLLINVTSVYPVRSTEEPVSDLTKIESIIYTGVPGSWLPRRSTLSFGWVG